jgi:2'-5' RNA ligase
MKDLRLFIALYPPPKAKRKIGSVIQSLEHKLPAQVIRPVKPENLHVTLHFLGNTPSGNIELLQRVVRHAVAESRTGPLRLSASRLGFFPPRGRPRVLQWEVSKTEQLTRLHGALAAGLSSTDFRVEKRSYRPHITLAKVGKRASAEAVEKMRRAVDRADAGHGLAISFSVETVVIVSSELTSSGPIYTPVAEAPLAKT